MFKLIEVSNLLGSDFLIDADFVEVVRHLEAEPGIL